MQVVVCWQFVLSVSLLADALDLGLNPMDSVQTSCRVPEN